MWKSGVSIGGHPLRVVVVAAQIYFLVTFCDEVQQSGVEESPEDPYAYHHVGSSSNHQFGYHNEAYANTDQQEQYHPTDIAAQQAEYIQYMQYMQQYFTSMDSMAKASGDTQPLHPSSGMAGVKELDRWTAADFIGGPRGVFLQLYTDTARCPFCAALAPQIRELGRHFLDEPAVVIAKADAHAQSPLVEAYGIAGAQLPSALFFPPGSTEPVHYEGPAHYSAMIEYLEELVPGIVKEGQLRAMRPYVQRFFAAGNSNQLLIREEVAAAQLNFDAERDETASDRSERYLAVMDRVLKHGPPWLTGQRTALVRKAHKLRDQAISDEASGVVHSADYASTISGSAGCIVCVR